MDSFVARQAIFDSNLNVWAYELLFRSELAGPPDPELSGDALDPLLEKLLNGTRALVRLRRAQLVSGEIGSPSLPPGTIVELWGIEPDEEVLAACAGFKQRGYSIALGGYAGESELDGLLGLADFLKTSVLTVPEGRQRSILEAARVRRIATVAEKVESREAWTEARERGYDYFQGGFFTQPPLVTAQQIPTATHNALALLRQMQAEEVDFGEVEEIVKREVGYSHGLLRYLNCPLFHHPAQVSSIRQALVLLGECEVRRWVTLATFARLGSGKPLELVLQSLERGRFCEMAGREVGLPPGVDAFLLGVFSLLPALLDQQMGRLLDELALAPELAAPLRGTAPANDRLAGILNLARAWESGDWSTVSAITNRLEITTASVMQIYLEAVHRADSVSASAYPAREAGRPGAAASRTGHAWPAFR